MNNEKARFVWVPLLIAVAIAGEFESDDFSLPRPLSAKRQGMTKSKVCCNASNNNTSTR